MPASPISPKSPTSPQSPASQTYHQPSISPPTISEILPLTTQHLTDLHAKDPIHECGRAALDLLRSRPDTALKFAYQKLHDVPYAEVKTCWRRLYVDAALGLVCRRVEEQSTNEDDVWCIEEVLAEEADGKKKEMDWVDEVVRTLDMALILSGAPERGELVELWFSALQDILGKEMHNPDISDPPGDPELHEHFTERPRKKRRLGDDAFVDSQPRLEFATSLPSPSPKLKHPILRVEAPSLSVFQKKLANSTEHTPLVLTGAIDHWPAICEPSREWRNPQYLLDQTLGGRRLVPVEIGRSYTDDGWGQKILSFGEFVRGYMLEQDGTDGLENSEGTEKQTAYLAQHDLFTQLPALRSDISVPDYCYLSPAPSSFPHISATAKLEDPLLNAWFGPKGTVSPLHTDPYHNILAQVVGYKYVRLYPPSETSKMYPRGREGGVDMGNTSSVDLDEAMALYSQISCWPPDGKQNGGTDESSAELKRRGEDFEEQFPEFANAKYVDAILGPGDCLYLPVGWWHYVRSLSASFSVSFWWN